MEEVNLLSESIKFMLLGMTVVFSFLLLLIFVLKIQAKIVQKYFPDNKIAPGSLANTKIQSAANSGKKDDSEVIAAITAAITDFRKN